jgi:hypothetical protein
MSNLIANLFWIIAALTVAVGVLITSAAHLTLPQVNIGFKMSDEITAGIIGAGAALIGAFIGAYVGYKFNEKLEASRTKERRQIQTKNVVFSPIYKQLRGLETYLELRQQPLKPTINVRFSPDRYDNGNSYTFDIWKNIKKDIRKLYVPEDKRNELDTLTEVLKGHMNLQDVTEDAIIQVASTFSQAHSDRSKNTNWNPRMLGTDLSSYSSGNTYPGLRNSVAEHLRTRFNFIDEEIEKYSLELLKQVDEHEAQKRLIESFNHVIEVTVKVTGSFESLVSDIITKYEGGINVR